MTAAWTTLADIAAKVRRRWDDESLLRTYASGAEFDPVEVSLRGPKPSQVGDDLAAAREWVAALAAGRRDDGRYSLHWQLIGGRQIGHPLRALELAPKMPRLIAAYVWLDSHRESRRYLREISAPGVDTKVCRAASTGTGGNAWRFVDSFGIPGRSWHY